MQTVDQCLSTSKPAEFTHSTRTTSLGAADVKPDKHVSTGDMSFETDPELLLNHRSNSLLEEAQRTPEVMPEGRIGSLLLSQLPERIVPSGSMSQSINQSTIFKQDLELTEQMRTHSLGSKHKHRIKLKNMKKGRRYRIKRWLRQMWALAVRVSRTKESD